MAKPLVLGERGQGALGLSEASRRFGPCGSFSVELVSMGGQVNEGVVPDERLGTAT